jgi:hypothetical protein
MPTEIHIQEGPGYKTILSHGPLSDTTTKILRFIVTEATTKMRHACLGQQNSDDRQWFVYGEIVSVGKFRERYSDSLDEQVIIVETKDDYDHAYFIVSTYNTRTRSGAGELFTKEEFFDNPVARMLRWDNSKLKPRPHPADWPGIFRAPKGTSE